METRTAFRRVIHFRPRVVQSWSDPGAGGDAIRNMDPAFKASFLDLKKKITLKYPRKY